MKKFCEGLIENITIDQVFDTIYSDKPFTLKGSEECFFAYLTKKDKNFNLDIGRYDNPGPEFYTGNH